MQRHSNIHISSLIVSFSILTIIVQFAAYYFLASSYMIWGISALISIICCHILLEQSITYETCFIYIVLTLFVSLTITVLIYFGMDHSTIPYNTILIGIVTINWLVPTLLCLLRNMFDYGARIENYAPFFRNNSIVFLLFYFVFIVYSAFAKGAFPWAYPVPLETANFIPFWVIPTQIEDYMNGLIPLSDIVIYLSSRILIYAPYGFFCALITRGHARTLRFLSLLMFPLLLEVLQFLFIKTRCDIDDLMYAFMGGILGSLGFYLINKIFHAVSGKEFLEKKPDYRFSNSTLHW